MTNSQNMTPALAVTKISHACYETPDLDRLTEYYTGILGLSLAARTADTAYLASTVDHHSVVLHRGDAARCSRLGFQLPPHSDLAECAARLARHGVEAHREGDPAPGISQQLSFLDPKGTVVEVFAPQPAVAVRFEERGIVPVKLGHVAFHVPDAEQVTGFYCDVLGFRVSDWLERVFSFLRCGADHHTVNFIGSGSTRHDHTAFELRDWSHMQSACDFLSRNGYRLIWGPGRHGIGHNLFTYHRNPDGMIVELYAELDRMSDESLGYFDPRPWHPDTPQRPKTWAMSPELVNLWRSEMPPPEMLEL